MSYKSLRLESKDNYVIIHLDQGKINLMNSQMIADIRAVIATIAKDDTVHGAIITGKEKFFIAGLDIFEIDGLADGKPVQDFWRNFFSMLVELSMFSKPLVAAISGHAPAAGALVGVCCEYRVMAEGKYRIGLNEAALGVEMPKFLYDLYEFVLGERKAYQFIMEAKLMDATTALSQNLVDQVLPAEEVLPAAEAKLQTYLNIYSPTWEVTKRNIRKHITENLEADFEGVMWPFLRQFWNPTLREEWSKLVASMKR